VTAATGVSRQTQDYLAAVEHELADLAGEDRSALLEDLALHLDALAAEDDDRPIAVRLGPPADYAADLRAAAGLPARGSLTATPSVGLRERLDAAVRRVVPAAREVRRLLRELRPAWWVLRGYLLVLVPCLLGGDYAEDLPVPAPLHSHLLGVLLVLAAVTASVVLGRRPLPRPVRVAVTVGGVLLVVVSAGVAQGVSEDLRGRVSAAAWAPAPDVASEEYPLMSRFGPVTDVLPYSADGTPLEGVLLFDQDGRPLRVGFQEWWADNCARVLEQPLAADEVPVPHSYPQSYVLDPAGVDLSRSIPRPADSCEADVPRPDVPLPTFPETAPAPGD
jgi:hypothetical protein